VPPSKHSFSASIAVIGSGYVGLTAAACFASLGHSVVCSDVSAERIGRLQAGECPIVEAGLPELLTELRRGDLLRFTADNADAIRHADFVFFCLPTPEGAGGHADLTFVRDAARELRTDLKSGAIVINKSTVPIGTAEMVATEIGRADIFVASNPEFLAEGTALDDFLHADRVVVGSDTPGVAARVAALYEGVDGPVVLTDVRSAEAIKYASNAFLATKLAFINSMAALCEATGADVRRVADGMGLDSRIGGRFLTPGPGWGGSCFPKDTHALMRTARDAGEPFLLLEAAVAANNDHRARIVEKVVRAAGGDLQGRVIALWGLTFKAGTNDLRDSPAREMAVELARLGASVRAYDPTVAEGVVDDVLVCSSPLDAATDADVLLVATEWPEFADLDLTSVRAAMARPAIVDARNVLDGAAAVAAGFRYQGLGVPVSNDISVSSDVELAAS
jgi:UDPglucose 6-dehydrogenase